MLSALRLAHDKSREIVLQYVVNFIDIPRHEFIKTAMECLPNDEKTMMNLVEQWKAESMQQGIQQGKQEGAELKQLEIARNMLTNGLQESLIEKITGLPLACILKLKEETKH